MAAEVVFAASVEGVTIPRRCLRPLYGSWTQWCEEQGIDPRYVIRVNITRDDDDTLTAHLVRFDTYPEGVKEAGSHVIGYGTHQHPCTVEGHPTGLHVHEVPEDLPVTSIQALLDHLDEYEAVAR